ncbi:MAG: hypothetical protein LBC19_13590 [Tannerella sp.]|jgi:Xaa-Pro aminopeptidase|nr:hypothetical protein [Tannerella sp.]
MFAKEIYILRRNPLKKTADSCILLFSDNDECGMNYESNIYVFRQDFNEIIRRAEHENIS